MEWFPAGGRCSMMVCMERFSWLAPMVLWSFAEPLLPSPVSRPQGGGTPRVQDEAAFAAIVYVLATDCAWRELPKVFGVSWQTTHRRFTQWAKAGVWTALEQLTADNTAADNAAAADTADNTDNTDNANVDNPGAVDESVRAWAAVVSTAAAARLRPAGAAEESPSEAAPVGRPRPRILREFSGQFIEQLFGRRKVVKPNAAELPDESPETSGQQSTTT
jgi:transposase